MTTQTELLHDLFGSDTSDEDVCFDDQLEAHAAINPCAVNGVEGCVVYKQFLPIRRCEAVQDAVERYMLSDVRNQAMVFLLASNHSWPCFIGLWR